MRSPKGFLKFLPLAVVGLGLLLFGVLLTPFASGQRQTIWEYPTNLPPPKLTLAAHEKQLRDQAMQTPEFPRQFKPEVRYPEGEPTGFSPIPSHPAGAGIIVDSGLAPFPSMEYTFENQWYEDKPDREIEVYAGADSDNPDQGLVVVVEIDSVGNPLPGSSGAFLTPQQLGSVHVIQADGERLFVQSIRGPRFIFNVATLSFR